MARPLMERFLSPELVPVLELATLPTPVEALLGLGEFIGCPALYVKRDDQTGTAYGGNKVRKLEFLLGQAKAHGAQTVLTFGAAGSNHCLATATYARQVGLKCIAMLVPQHNAHSVRRNLLAGFAVGSELDLRASRAAVAAGTAAHFAREYLHTGHLPSVFPAGGSSPVGCLGYVNAALELEAQVEAGLLPEPDWIYVASGTMGTCVGLLFGLGLTRLKTKVMAVAVTSPPYTSLGKANKLFQAVAEQLPGCSGTPFPEERFVLRHDFLGEEYALYTEAGCAAVDLVKQRAGLHLEGTYTGKAFAALLQDAEKGELREKTVLFWNTYSGVDLSPRVEGIEYHQLPAPLHRFFEEPVQRLDRAAG